MRKDVAAFFNTLDRSLFIDNEYKELAGIDTPLPIGYGQTISQPSLVAYMTDALHLDRSCSVLEIGTGSGYQTAFLAQFAGTVYTIELIPALAGQAKSRLDKLGCRNIVYRIGDGSSGWPEQAPFDRIILTAAPRSMPSDIIDQLATGGEMILPVGPYGCQQLMFIQRAQNGTISRRILMDVAFVELKGKYD
jgi:protein-L-isoaspartate(D-aspartate) O-methyltransferase